MWWSRRLAVVALLALCTGCGFRPLYGESAGDLTKELAGIRVSLIADRVGQELHNVLLDRLNPHGVPAKARYVLDVRLTIGREELGIRKDETATRANLEMMATFSLRRAADGVVVFEGRSRSTTSFNIVTSEFAMLSAEIGARRRAVILLGDDIKTRLVAFLTRVGAASI